MFEIMDRPTRTTDGRTTTEHGYTLSSPYEPDSSDELINNVLKQLILKILFASLTLWHIHIFL